MGASFRTSTPLNEIDKMVDIITNNTSVNTCLSNQHRSVINLNK